MRTKLSTELLGAYKTWKDNQKRTSWLYCPLCRHDLNGDDKSFTEEKNDCWYFKCDRCGCMSEWGLYSMLPVVNKYQHLKKKLDHTPEALPSVEGLGGDTGTLPTEANGEK